MSGGSWEVLTWTEHYLNVKKEWWADLVKISWHELTATTGKLKLDYRERRQNNRGLLKELWVLTDNLIDIRYRAVITDHASQQTVRQSHHGCQGRKKSVKWIFFSSKAFRSFSVISYCAYNKWPELHVLVSALKL